jgi:hypothetical protein
MTAPPPTAACPLPVLAAGNEAKSQKAKQKRLI